MARTEAQNQAIRLKRKTKIIRNGLKLFAENGIKNTSVDDITKASMCSHGTFYNYFNSIDNLYSYCMNEYITDYYGKEYTLNLENASSIDYIFERLSVIFEGPTDVLYYYMIICHNFKTVLKLHPDDYLLLEKLVKKWDESVDLQEQLDYYCYIVCGIIHSYISGYNKPVTMTEDGLRELLINNG